MPQVSRTGGTVTLTLRPGEQNTLDWVESTYGNVYLKNMLDQWFDQQKAARKAADFQTLQQRYDAASNEIKAQVNALLNQ
jgi:hypothetical protein